MHDIRFIRDNPQAFDAALKRRGLPGISAEILELDGKRRAAQTAAQERLARRNQASKEIGQRKAKKEDAADLMAEVARLKDEIAAAESQEREAGTDLEGRLAVIPNLPAEDVPDGADETDNKEVRRWGEPTRLDFPAKDHADLGEGLKLMDFERAAKISGARFTVLSGSLARLHRALGQFMLDLHTGEFGYTEVDPPILVRDKTAYGTGNLPKFADDLFSTTFSDRAGFQEHLAKELKSIGIEKFMFGAKGGIDLRQEDIEGKPNQIIQIFAEAAAGRVLERKLWLIPTAEVALTNLVADEIVEETTLPRRYTALTACFRAEAGAAGKDTRGMLRQHQFYKVELVSIVHPDKSNEEHERMTAAAEEVLKRLKLPYRTIVLCTGDMGFASRKTYDIEVWLPGQNTYREISSCSNCGDFQARRMNARFKAPGGKGTQFLHTLNGSGIAVGRALIAVMENYQQKDGTIRVPDALKPYMGGVEVIGANS